MMIVAQISDLIGGATDGAILIPFVAVPLIVVNFFFFLLAGGKHTRIIARICILISIVALIHCYFLPLGLALFLALILLAYCILVILIGSIVMLINRIKRYENMLEKDQ